jgi:hypothetical protein
MVSLAFGLGLRQVELAAWLLLLTLGLRVAFLAREARRWRFRSAWLPLLVQSLEAVPDPLPPVRKRDWSDLLDLWNYCQESVRGESREHLNRLARRAGIDRAARQMLTAGSVPRRLAAAAALGFLKEPTAWDALRCAAAARDPHLSLAAGRALVHIDPEAAISLLTPLISARTDWPAARVAGMLQEAGPEAVSRPLAEAALNASSHTAVRLIRYLEATRCASALPVVRQILPPVSPAAPPAHSGACGRGGELRLPAIELDLAADGALPVGTRHPGALGRNGAHRVLEHR